MKWVNSENNVPIKSWCENVEDSAMEQAKNLANHPCTFKHVALMPDCHSGYGMPIGGVIAFKNAVCPHAVGVDIGCGMGAIGTNIDISSFPEGNEGMKVFRSILDMVKDHVPVGEGHARAKEQEWNDDYFINDDPFNEYSIDNRGWFDDSKGRSFDLKNLGTLGGGNHFIEIQASDDNKIWLMVHSGSRNLGHRIASYYHKEALAWNEKWHSNLPSKDLAFFPADDDMGQAYIEDMNLALRYARENRRIIMEQLKIALDESCSFLGIDYNIVEEVNIHHNYAAIEKHFGRNVWIHRKGATSAKKGEIGIIPGSMGTSSYIVGGLGNMESFMSCSHGAGRKMSRTDACISISKNEADKAMEGIVHDRWGNVKRGKAKGKADLSESPLAYKNIDEVIASETDLVEVLVKLRPLAVLKG